ncbi:GNAT family N-acetyltransferase [Streptomyces purpurascens]|uniref:GNAT family N-acetyltransferase n=1 Tax=Streptomyces purpurascens TaxID=1924 RepID=A0ABZ1ML97_STREF|nr:N-acetyltransferase [Streptomyces purpurascens]
MRRETVTLSRIVSEDWAAVHAWAGLAEACRYQPWGPNTPDETREFVAGAVAAWSESPQRRFPYVARLGREVVGMGELRVRSAPRRQGEISYIVHPRVWGRGIGTQIGRLLLAHAFGELRLHRVHATCDPRNLGSARVLAKLGMTREGRLRHTLLLRDGWRDSLVFGVLEDEWDAASAVQG